MTQIRERLLTLPMIVSGFDPVLRITRHCRSERQSLVLATGHAIDWIPTRFGKPDPAGRPGVRGTQDRERMRIGNTHRAIARADGQPLFGQFVHAVQGRTAPWRLPVDSSAIGRVACGAFRIATALPRHPRLHGRRPVIEADPRPRHGATCGEGRRLGSEKQSPSSIAPAVREPDRHVRLAAPEASSRASRRRAAPARPRSA